MAREEMMEAAARVAPYEGNEDYIFISYSHRDLAEVMPLLRSLQEAGFRFWYDEGIDPGTEWPESIAQHLNRARVCLALLSPDSLDSQNCRREINFALSKSKDFLSVVLRPVQMTPGMEMQISTYQSLLKYKYPQENAFLKKLLAVELLQSCRQAPPAPAAPAPAAGKAAPAAEKAEPAAQPPAAEQPALAAETPAPAAQAPAEEPPAPAPAALVPAADTAPAVPAAPPPKKRPQFSLPPMNKRLLVILAAALAVVVGVWFALGGAQAHFSVGETVYRDDVGAQRLTGVSLSAAELHKLAAFRKCSSLSFTDCTLESSALPQLAKMQQLTKLAFENCQGVDDLSFVNSLPALHILVARGCGLAGSVLPELTGEDLAYLDLRDNALTAVPAVADPTRIKTLYLGGNALSTLEPLAAFTALQALDISGTGADTLAVLEGNQNLTELYAGGNSIKDVSPLERCIYLRALDLSNNPIATLAPLAYCEQLQRVSVRGCKGCAALETLAASSKTMTWLDLSDNTDIVSLAPLEQFTALTVLCADNCSLTSCDGIHAAGLETLSLAGNNISDISALATGTANLRRLNLADNALEELPPLGGMGSDELYLGYIFSNNRLHDLTNLPDVKYDYLLVDGNPITEFAGSGLNVAFDCTEDAALSTLDGFFTYYVTDVFIGKQAELEKTAGVSHTIHYVTPQEAFEALAAEAFPIALVPPAL